MQKYSFTRSNALVEDDRTVVVTQSEDDEVIEIATDWLVGEAAQNFDKKSTEDDVKNNLFGEYKLLAMCHWFKTRFDQHAISLGATTIPKFYFNYLDSILGKLKPSLSSTSTHVPFLHFIATPLLPCSTVDAKVKKFTGNEHFGEASDDMTKAIHAFVHFSVAYSNDYILFCDLQGTLDSNGLMCLFDPQAHTNTTTSTHYWDLGSKAFSKVIAQHYDVCENNWVCKRLSLDNLKVEKVLQSPQRDDYNQASGRPLTKPRRNPMNVISILNSDDE